MLNNTQEAAAGCQQVLMIIAAHCEQIHGWELHNPALTAHRLSASGKVTEKFLNPTGFTVFLNQLIATA